jgi:hypothetical protein
VVQIKGYPNYLICPRTFKVFSMKKGKPKQLEPSTRHPTEMSFILYKNGFPHLVSYWEILKNNWGEIINFRSSLAVTRENS